MRKTILSWVLLAATVGACSTPKDNSQVSSGITEKEDFKLRFIGNSYRSNEGNLSATITFHKSGRLVWQDPLAGHPGGHYVYQIEEAFSVDVYLVRKEGGHAVFVQTIQVSQDLTEIEAGGKILFLVSDHKTASIASTCGIHLFESECILDSACRWSEGEERCISLSHRHLSTKGAFLSLEVCSNDCFAECNGTPNWRSCYFDCVSECKVSVGQSKG